MSLSLLISVFLFVFVSEVSWYFRENRRTCWGKNNLGLIPSCLWVTTSSMFSQPNFIGTRAVSTLCRVFRSFWHICGMEGTDGEAHLALLVAGHLPGLPQCLDCRYFLWG